MLKFKTGEEFEVFLMENFYYEMSENEHKMLANPDIEINQD